MTPVFVALALAGEGPPPIRMMYHVTKLKGHEVSHVELRAGRSQLAVDLPGHPRYGPYPDDNKFDGPCFSRNHTLAAFTLLDGDKSRISAACRLSPSYTKVSNAAEAPTRSRLTQTVDGYFALASRRFTASQSIALSQASMYFARAVWKSKKYACS